MSETETELSLFTSSDERSMNFLENAKLNQGNFHHEYANCIHRGRLTSRSRTAEWSWWWVCFANSRGSFRKRQPSFFFIFVETVFNETNFLWSSSSRENFSHRVLKGIPRRNCLSVTFKRAVNSYLKCRISRLWLHQFWFRTKRTRGRSGSVVLTLIFLAYGLLSFH